MWGLHQNAKIHCRSSFYETSNFSLGAQNIFP